MHDAWEGIVGGVWKGSVLQVYMEWMEANDTWAVILMFQPLDNIRVNGTVCCKPDGNIGLFEQGSIGAWQRNQLIFILGQAKPV